MTPHDKRLGQWAVVWLALMVLVAAWFAFQVGEALSQDERYLILYRQAYVFERRFDLPYVAYDEMAWTEERGFYEITEPPYYRYAIIDLETGKLAYAMQTGERCFVLWMHPYYGADNNPHVELAEWTSCEPPTL